MNCFIKQRDFNVLIMNQERLNELQEEKHVGNDGELMSLWTRGRYEATFPLSPSSCIFATGPFNTYVSRHYMPPK